jgi:hypothetical protein
MAMRATELRCGYVGSRDLVVVGQIFVSMRSQRKERGGGEREYLEHLMLRLGSSVPLRTWFGSQRRAAGDRE